MEDPRCNLRNQVQYSIHEIFFLVIAAVVSGCNDWKEIALFGKVKVDWLRKFFPYTEGTPCNTTLSRFFSKLDPESFGQLFSEWVASLSELTEGQLVAIDGKTLRGSYDRKDNKAALHMVSAFVSRQGLCLGQLATDAKSNEVTAIPKLLDLLTLEGAILTIDAMGCQKEIAKEIVAKRADYILQVKGNQKGLLEQVEKVFQITSLTDTHTQHTFGHDRIEQRTSSIITDLTYLDDREDWKALKSVVRVESVREHKASGNMERSTRYYISSRTDSAQIFNDNIRSHWAIENQLHWTLDVTFNEDKSRKRVGYSPHNFNIISKIALTLINDRESGSRMSKKNKRTKAALSDVFREELLKI